MQKKQSKVIKLIFLNKSFSIIGTILVMATMAVGYVTLVKTLILTQGFFVLLFTVIISIYCSKILKEDIRKSVIITKLIAIALMFTGVLLII